MITISETAQRHITNLLKEEPAGTHLRTFVQGGGCSGFQYGFTFEDQISEDDFTIDINDYKMIVDAMSMQYLDGAEIDYKTDLSGSSFVIKNPNAVSTCGCGSSFTV
jgi:iron-sulfur cluster insertion protein